MTISFSFNLGKILKSTKSVNKSHVTQMENQGYQRKLFNSYLNVWREIYQILKFLNGLMSLNISLRGVRF